MIHRSATRLVGTLVLLLVQATLVGCPADPPTPPAPTTSRPDDPDVPASKGGPTVTREQPPSPPSTEKSREQLLAMTPGDALRDGLRGTGTGGLAPTLAGEGAVAMAEQLRAASVPVEALDLCVVAFDRARERTTGTIDAAVRKDLETGVEVQAADAPALRRWVKALAERAYQRQDLEAAVTFLMKVRELQVLSQTLTQPR